MKINEENKRLYEAAFIPNGKYASKEGSWKPSIYEHEIHEWQVNEEGKRVPATPLGYRDYTISRLEGLKNIINGSTALDLTENDKLHKISRDDGTIKQYDKIHYQDTDFIVVGDEEDKFFFVNEDNHLFFTNYLEDNQ